MIKSKTNSHESSPQPTAVELTIPQQKPPLSMKDMPIEVFHDIQNSTTADDLKSLLRAKPSLMYDIPPQQIKAKILETTNRLSPPILPDKIEDLLSLYFSRTTILRNLREITTSSAKDSLTFKADRRVFRSPNGRYVAIIDKMRMLQIYDFSKSPAKLTPIGPELTGLRSEPSDITYSPDSRFIAFQDYGISICLIDTNIGKVITKLRSSRGEFAPN